MAQNCHVGLSGLVPLGLSLQEHPSDETPPPKTRGQKSGPADDTEWVWQTGWDAASSPLHTSSCLWGNVTITERAASVCPTKQGKKSILKTLRSNRKGNFKEEQFRHCWLPGVFDPWPRVKSSALLQGGHWDVSHLLPTHRNQACGICSLRLILARQKWGLILAWDPNANPLGKPCSPGHFPAIWVIPG